MSAAPAEKRTWTREEYLAWERTQPTKHEYCQGEIFAMPGASLAHNRIVANVLRLLGNALLDKPCEPLPSDMRVKVPVTELYTYPDATVCCGRPELEEGHEDTLLNPRLIVEVLSDSTEAYDRGEKFENYQSIPSFEEYLLVPQDRVRIDHFVKQPDGAWLMRVRRAGETFELASIGCAISVDEMYRNVFQRPDSGAA